jgi:hypothetical protein
MTNHADWQELARALRELHRALVERARTDYLRDHGIGGDVTPGELLRLLTSDAYFEWLRSLSELMVDIDLVRELADRGELVQSGAVRAAVEYLVSPPVLSETPSVFAQRYWPYVQEDPNVAMAHGQLKRVLSNWPAAKSADRGSLSTHRSAVRDRARAPRPRR